MDFIALDFETATHEKNSACELGLCIVENGQIKETRSWLIKPPSFPYFNHHNIAVHGITPQDVQHAPTFADIWYEVENLMYGNIMIAHNAAFDANVLRGCLQHYGFFKPNINYLCSIGVAKKAWKNLKSYGLKHLAEQHQINFNHHRADADAEVCAKISLLSFERLMITNNDEVKAVFEKRFKIL